MSIKPTSDRILVKPLNPETATKSGIIIPDNAQEKPQRGTVISTGKGRLLDNGNYVAPEVSADDVVLYGKHAGTPVKIDSEDYIILKEDDILGVITEE